MSLRVFPFIVTTDCYLKLGTKADGLTAAAAGLWPYYEAKKVVKFFIVVTDEIDNEKYKGLKFQRNFIENPFSGHYFPTLFQKYCKEVFPAKIVFVSFLDNPSEKGRMVKALESMGIIPLQFRLDGKRPDLTKLDSLLGNLRYISESNRDKVCYPVNLRIFQNKQKKCVCR